MGEDDKCEGGICSPEAPKEEATESKESTCCSDNKCGGCKCCKKGDSEQKECSSDEKCEEGKCCKDGKCESC